MRITSALTTLAAIACLSPALAQSDSVTVNGVGGRVLIDPATGQERYVPELRQPWQDQPIRLRPPRKHARSTPSADSYASVPEAAAEPKPRRAARPQTEAPADSFASVPQAAPVAPAKPKRTATATPRPAAPPPKQQSAPISGFSDFTDLISPQSAAPAAKPKASPPPPRAAAVKPAEPPKVVEPPKAEKPVQRASIEPSKPSKPRIVAGAKKDTIAFAPNASDPSTSAVASIRTLAGSLNSALSDASARVQLMAYAGMRGEKSSDTRRLSLKRALVVRQLLIDDGVPAERIDVFALGGADDEGPLDRVDVLIKS